MANERHLARLRQGVEAWNAWRAANRNRRLEVDLSRADLFWANLFKVDTEVDLSRADLFRANLFKVDLTAADLQNANLRRAALAGAQLTGAQLTGADLRETNLSRADLRKADLCWADFREAYLGEADLTRAKIGMTSFGNVNLSTVRGLETVWHSAPSTIGIDTLYRSHGNIPEAFLRGAGVPDEMISYSKSLIGQPFQYHSCFISYSSHDEPLAQRLHADLQDNGVRCWFAPEDLKIGDEFRSRIDESIQVYDRLLLILSDHSVRSRWVQKEVETAFEKESKENRIVLFPIQIDDAVMQSAVGWAADIRRQRHIGNFRQWKDYDAYRKAFNRLLHDLKATI